MFGEIHEENIEKPDHFTEQFTRSPSNSKGNKAILLKL